MSRFRIGDSVNFAASRTGNQFTGEIVDIDVDATGCTTEYTISVETATGPGLLQATADKMRKTGRGIRGGAR